MFLPGSVQPHQANQIEFIELRPEKVLPVVAPVFPDRTKEYEQAKAEDEAAKAAQEAAEAARKAQAAQKVQDEAVSVIEAPAPLYAVSDHIQMMTAAGIDPSEFSAVEELIQKESSWNPLAVNPYSGACGLSQALPCSKVPGDWSNPVDSLRWGNGYVRERYGGWFNALAHSHSYGWY